MSEKCVCFSDISIQIPGLSPGAAALLVPGIAPGGGCIPAFRGFHSPLPHHSIRLPRLSPKGLWMGNLRLIRPRTRVPRR